jgi:hypothetical protein
LLSFLGLADLIRSKETERASDWADVQLLEEFLDARHLAGVNAGTLPVSDALARLRSRVGLEGFLRANCLTDPSVVAQALAAAKHVVAQALLLPFAPAAPICATTPCIEPVVEARLRATPPASRLHLTLLEAVRRQYRAFHQDADRRDKDAAWDAGPRP